MIKKVFAFRGVLPHKNVKKLILARAFPACGSLSGLVPSRWPVLGEAFVAVDGPSLGRLEGNFTFLSAVRAGRLVHLPWSTVEAAPFAVIHSFHSFLCIVGHLTEPDYTVCWLCFLPLNLCVCRGVLCAWVGGGEYLHRRRVFAYSGSIFGSACFSGSSGGGGRRIS
jgi:hypothetical protein